MERIPADLYVGRHGSIATLTPATEGGEAWLRDNLAAEPWQLWGGGVAMEPRYLDAIVDGARDDGLVVEGQ